MSPRAVWRNWPLTIVLVMVVMLLGMIAPVVVAADSNQPTITPTQPYIPPAPASNSAITNVETLPPTPTETPIPSITPTSPPEWQQPFVTDSNARLNRILIVVIFLAGFVLIGMLVFWLYLNTRGKDYY